MKTFTSTIKKLLASLFTLLAITTLGFSTAHAQEKKQIDEMLRLDRLAQTRTAVAWGNSWTSNVMYDVQKYQAGDRFVALPGLCSSLAHAMTQVSMSLLQVESADPGLAKALDLRSTYWAAQDTYNFCNRPEMKEYMRADDTMVAPGDTKTLLAKLVQVQAGTHQILKAINK